MEPEKSPVTGWLSPIIGTWQSIQKRNITLTMKPALAGFILCIMILGSMLYMGKDDYIQKPAQSDMDWGYIETCQRQHEEFASSNMLTDGSVAALRERSLDLSSGNR